jgi:RecG-like helicase
MGLKQSGQQDYLIADLDRDFGLLEQALHLVPGIIKSNSEGKYRILLHLFGYANYLRKSD